VVVRKDQHREALDRLALRQPRPGRLRIQNDTLPRTLFLHICDPAGQALDSPAHRPDRAVTLRGSSALIEWTDRRNGEVSGALGDAWPSAFLNGKPA
jgi:hypothetical protein